MLRILDHWALILLCALTMLLVALICETSWPIAYVYIVTSPSGSTVFDGEGFQWTTPAWIPVSHRGLQVTISHPGRVTVDTVLTPAMWESPVLVTLPYVFSLRVTSDPPGASILLDGSLAGQTPALLLVNEPGTHLLQLATGDMVAVTDSISLLGNFPDTLHYLLPREYGSGMVLVPSGEGSRSGLDYTYLISSHEVTNREFRDYLQWLEPVPVSDSTIRWGRTAVIESMFPGDYPLPFHIGSNGQWAILEGMEDHPVAGMTYQAALDYCRWLTVRDPSGVVFRLPTGEEWKIAALGGNGGPWPWGDRRPDGRLLNLSDSNEGILRRHPSLDDGYRQTSPVCTYPANGWGLYDMAGNVWEYCLPQDSGCAPPAMGGSWLSSMDDCRCDAVMLPDTGLGYPYIGFRLAATLDPALY
jgi:hypothetical protein